jgi:hypothetical protein
MILLFLIKEMLHMLVEVFWHDRTCEFPLTKQSLWWVQGKMAE